MNQRTGDEGRPAQRRRTRSAIIAAAARLLSTGQTPSVSDIADAAEVSRRTVYMHFPTLDQLLVDASLETVARSSIEPVIESTDQETDNVEARVERMARAVQRSSAET